jgi:general secretion pathway protein D
MNERRGRLGLALALAAALAGAGCSAHWAYRQGIAEGRKDNWDLAVARLTAALQRDPDNVRYKISLENARVRASLQHYEKAKKHMAAEELEKAADELDIATKYDPQNKSAADDLRIVRTRIQKREDEKRARESFEATKARASQAVRLPTPVLSPRSPAPITLKFSDTSLEKIFEALGKLAGVNLVTDQDFRDKKVSINVVGVTFEEALDQLTFLNRLFYKVIDQNTIVVVPESPQKRRSYDDLLVQTYYLQNAESKEVTAVVKAITGIQKVVENPNLGAITLTGTLDQLALAQRVIDANDKPRGEVMVEVQILEVNRTRLKDWGIRLAGSDPYQAGITLDPFGSPPATGGSGGGASTTSSTGLTQIRAHFLSSLSLADFVVSIPSGLLARFLQTEATVQLLAAPKLRAAEGKKTALKIVSQIPVATATFQSTSTIPGAGVFTPTTQIQYRDVGVTLELTPKITVAGEITLELTAEFSLLGQEAEVAGQKQPTFLTRNLTGILRLRDGETSLIGGLLQGRENQTFSGLLGLRNLPVLNKVFGSNTRNKDDSEILISITPHIVRAPKVVEEDLVPLYVGTLERLRVPSANPPLFGLAEPPAPSPSPSPGTVPEKDKGAPSDGAPPADKGAAPPTAPAPAPGAAAAPPVAPEAAPASPAGGPGPPPAGGTQARFAPAAANVKVGETGALGVVLVNGRDVLSVEVVLAYDPNLIEAADLAPGALLSLDGAQVAMERQLDTGRARARFTRPTGGSGSGTVAMFTFKGLKSGTSAVLVEALTITTSSGAQPVAVAGQGRVAVSE